MIFTDRIEAGKRLADEMIKIVDREDKGVVLGIPRGGVVIAKIIAEELGWELEVIISKKLVFLSMKNWQWVQWQKMENQYGVKI